MAVVSPCRTIVAPIRLDRRSIVPPVSAITAPERRGVVKSSALPVGGASPVRPVSDAARPKLAENSRESRHSR